MKRSEAVKLIQEVYFDYGLGFDDELEGHVASAILDKLENAGMKPLSIYIDEGFLRSAGIDFEYEKE